ncbi:DUF421 domain-containing protein [Hymenobacter sp. DG25A]|uniref:DUF421 domain-containing protein n=1 Tax=Hymenobacter sp. DG25A TaxID=1385663 RepID=UPI0006BD840C|nr:YetF domain-containing protein [Hymenobacter sp. DG25A]ALD20000.1 hypothetical protein AM218_00615 [Hymenobacter sp. DG25A]
MEELNELLGLHVHADDITALQMSIRAVVIFFVALAQLRLAGTRAFSSGSAFDMVLKIILGAVLARAIVAASPFWPTIIAATVFVVLHRLLAIAAYYSDFVGLIIKGKARVLVENGELKTHNLRRTNITRNDLMEGLRDSGGLEESEHVRKVVLERNGHISVIKQHDKPPKPNPES